MNRRTGAGRGANAKLFRGGVSNAIRTIVAAAGIGFAGWGGASSAEAQAPDRVLAIPEAVAATEAEMKAYSSPFRWCRSRAARSKWEARTASLDGRRTKDRGTK